MYYIVERFLVTGICSRDQTINRFERKYRTILRRYRFLGDSFPGEKDRPAKVFPPEKTVPEKGAGVSQSVNTLRYTYAELGSRGILA